MDTDKTGSHSDADTSQGPQGCSAGGSNYIPVKGSLYTPDVSPGRLYNGSNYTPVKGCLYTPDVCQGRLYDGSNYTPAGQGRLYTPGVCQGRLDDGSNYTPVGQGRLYTPDKSQGRLSTAGTNIADDSKEAHEKQLVTQEPGPLLPPPAILAA